MNPRDEYNALRAEVLDWQRRRTAVAMQTATVVVAILGFATSLSDELLWSLLSSSLLFLVAVSIVFALYAADAASRLGAYIEIFHEGVAGGWEGRAHLLRGSNFQNLNSVLGGVYVSLGILAVAVPAAGNAAQVQPWYGWTLLGLTGLAFAILAYRLIMRSYSYREKYREILRSERGSDPDLAGDAAVAEPEEDE